jgi:poly-gamma-glutamate synthesis protein (capsule biosynthesis protein)
MGDDTYVVDLTSDKNIEKTVAEAKANSDLMIAVLHVGKEYVYTPNSSAQKQVDRVIDAGADIVLCAHPHVVETYGMRTTAKGNTALVYYSLGNFISSQNQIPRMIGGMADITLGITKEADNVTIELLDYQMIPVVTHIKVNDAGSIKQITTYFLSDYTDELCAEHREFKKENYTVDDIYKLYDEMVTEADHLISREWNGKIYMD